MLLGIQYLGIWTYLPVVGALMGNYTLSPGQLCTGASGLSWWGPLPHTGLWVKLVTFFNLQAEPWFLSKSLPLGL